MCRDNQQAPVVAYCALCKGEQYRGDPMYEWEGQRICEACMERKFDVLTTAEKADLLGAAQVRAGD